MSDSKPNKEKVLALARQGAVLEKAEDLLKEPYVFEFISVREKRPMLEKKATNKNYSPLIVLSGLMLHRKFECKSIKVKLLVTIICMLIITGVVLTVISALMATSALEEAAIDSIQIAGAGTAKKVTLLNAAGMDMITSIAHDQRIIQGMEQWNAGTLSPEEQTEISFLFAEELGSMHTIFDRLNVLDLDGTCVLTNNPSNVGRDYSGEEFFRNQKDGSYTANPHQGVDGNRRFTYVIKVYDINGEQTGLAMLALSLSDIESLLFSREGLSDDAEIFLVDSDGTIISGINGDYSPFLKDKFDLGIFSSGITTVRGQGYHGNAAHIDKTPVDDADWFVIVTESVASVNEQIMNLTTMMVTSLIGVIAIGSLATIFIANSFARPIQALTKTSHEIALGNTNVRVEHTSADEIGELANSFRQMIANIKEDENAATRIAQGNIDFEVYIASEHDSKGKALAQMREILADIVQALQALATHSADGIMSIFDDTSQFQGVYKDLIETMSKTFNTLQEAYTHIQAQNEELQASEEELRQQFGLLQEHEEALKKSEEKYRRILENLLDMYYMCDENYIIRLASKSFVTPLGYDSLDDIIGHHVAKFLFEPWEKVGALFDSNKYETVTNLPLKLKTRGGNVVECLMSGKPIYEDDVLVGREGIIKDITDIHMIQEELARQNSVLLAVKENLASGLYITDENRKTFMWNQKFTEEWGFANDELEKDRSFDFIKQGFTLHDDPERHLSIVDRIEADRTMHLHDEVLKVDNTVLERYSAPITDSGGRYYGRIWEFREITERKQYEKSISEANHKMLILSQITRHDITNQLGVCFGTVDLLSDVIDDDPSTKNLLKIMKKSLSTIKHQIEFTRDYQEIGLSAAGWQDVNSSITRARDALILPPVELIANDIPLIFADPLFDKVVYNLIENSLRHGKRVSEMRVTFSSENNEGLLVFTDNGGGIEPENKEKIFERGYGKNTGLGLFLVREILDITDITIHECGTMDVGARFEIRIPRGGWKKKG